MGMVVLFLNLACLYHPVISVCMVVLIILVYIYSIILICDWEGRNILVLLSRLCTVGCMYTELCTAAYTVELILLFIAEWCTLHIQIVYILVLAILFTLIVNMSLMISLSIRMVGCNMGSMGSLLAP